jgi:hypothetical protein
MGFLGFARVVIFAISSAVFKLFSYTSSHCFTNKSAISKNERSSSVFNFGNGDQLSSKDLKMAGIPVALPAVSSSSFKNSPNLRFR